MIEDLWLDFARVGFCASVIVFFSGYVVGCVFRFVKSFIQGKKL